MALFWNFQIPSRVVLIRNLAKRALLASVRGHWKKKTEMQAKKKREAVDKQRAQIQILAAKSAGDKCHTKKGRQKGEKCDQTAFTREQLRKQWSIVSFQEHDAQ